MCGCFHRILFPASSGRPLWTGFSSQHRLVNGGPLSPRRLPPLLPPRRAPVCASSAVSLSERRRRPRRGKQVPGCQSRTRAEQERTGLNRREQIPAGRRAPPPARPAIHTAYVAGSRARPRSLACWAGGGAGRGGRRGASV